MLTFKKVNEITSTTFRSLSLVMDRTHNGCTALASACEKGHEEIVKLLLKSCKANEDSKDKVRRYLLSFIT